MDLGVWKARVSSRPAIVTILVVVVLAGLAFRTIRQSRLIAEQRLRIAAVEREEAARAAAEAERATARTKRNTEWAASDARVQQLYREIDTLSRINERVLAKPPKALSTPVKADDEPLEDESLSPGQ
jgi:hypothetical protein